MDFIRGFPKADYILAMLLRGYEVEMRELGHRSSDLIVKGTLRYFPAVKVNDGNSKHRRRKGR